MSISITLNFMIVPMVMGSFSEILSHRNQNSILVPNLKIASFQNIIKSQAMDFIWNFMDFSFTVRMYDKSMEGVSWVTSVLFL